MEISNREFLLEGKPVGYFTDQDYPSAAGRYRYSPHRSAAHYEMQRLVQAGAGPRCYYETDTVRVFFTVHDCPEYGVLELGDFHSERRNDG
jgi:hypothetical protein